MSGEISPFSAPCGAEVTGVDFSKPVKKDFVKILNRAFVKHSVLVVRDQKLTPKQMVVAVGYFGSIFEQHNKIFSISGCPEVHYISNQESYPDGTRYIPGTHLRVVSEAAISRYQNIKGQQRLVCKAGTLLFLHMGIWHGGGLNESDRVRYMFKIRLCPTERQSRLWDDSDMTNDHFEQRPIFWTRGEKDDSHLHEILTRSQPWFENDTGRLEYMNRIRFWRYLLGDDHFDADYWLTRVENEFV